MTDPRRDQRRRDMSGASADPGTGAVAEELDQQEKAFAAQVADALEQGNGALDAGTLSRLRRARARALAHRPRRRWWPGVHPALLGPAAGIVAASALALLTVPALLERPAGLPAEALGTGAPMDGGAAEDLEIVLSVDNLEMIEDLEFFEWLAAQPEVI